MPRGDRTGPAGAGPMTGRGMGICAGFNQPGFVTGGGGGRGMGRGRGFNFRNRFFAGWQHIPQAPAQPLNKAEQVSMLKEQMTRIQQQIEALGDD
ncbi:MAG: DUF5320 domain-containing protein [Kiritimatiellaeota bacterium]|nr:DUF5320 domain-containing protein [Kiritimatiellota bacterium]